MISDLLIENGIKLQTKIGEGSFGQVFKGEYLEKEVAIKVFTNHLQETSIMETISHPNIIQFIKYLKFNSKNYLVMEYAAGGSLQQLIGQELSENQISEIMISLFSAVEYLHQHCIIHRDIKPENILIKDLKDLKSIKIADFGLSFQYKEENRHFPQVQQQCGTFIFMAPEQIMNQSYNKQVDIWSCGIVMYMLLSKGKHPYYPRLKTKQQLVDELPNLKIQEIEGISYLAKDLLKRLLCIDKNYRYNASIAKVHPWTTQKFTTSIPMHLEEQGKCQQLLTHIVKRIKIIMLISFIKQNQPIQSQNQITSFQNLDFQSMKPQKTLTEYDIEDDDKFESFADSNRYVNTSVTNIKIHRTLKKASTLKPIIMKSCTQLNSQRNLQQQQSQQSQQLQQYQYLQQQQQPFIPNIPTRQVPNPNLKLHQLNSLLNQFTEYSPKKYNKLKYSITQNLEDQVEFNSMSPVKLRDDLNNQSPEIKLRLNKSSNRIILPVLTDSTQCSLSPIKKNRVTHPPLRKSQSSFFFTKMTEAEMNSTTIRQIEKNDQSKQSEAQSISHRKIRNIQQQQVNQAISPKKEIIQSILEQQKLNLILPKQQQAVFRFKVSKPF